LVILLGFLVIIMAVVVLAIWSTGDGFGGVNGGQVTMVSIDEWDRSGLSQDAHTGNEENTNMESQTTIYPLPIQPSPGEVVFITRLSGHVEWVDESSLPAQVGGNLPYQNEPDSFQLIIRIEDSLGEWQSELVYNTMGSPGSIDLEVDLVSELGGPLAVANPQGANYLPEGYVQALRVDFIVYTGECGDWVLEPLPVVGDGGNHFTYDWVLEYQVDSTKDDPR
jgi:hypothetical protein